MTPKITKLAAIAMLSAAALVTVACATSSPAPAADSVTPEEQLTPLFFQCLALHDVPLWSKAAGDVNVAAAGRKQGWYVNGKVISNGYFAQWSASMIALYPIGADFKPYQTAEDWISAAAAAGMWPRACGPKPPAAATRPSATPAAPALPMTASVPAPGTDDGTMIAVAFSPDGRTIASIDGGHVYFDSVASRTLTAAIAPADDGSSLTAEAFSPDGRTLAVADTSGKIYLYDTVTRALRATLAAPGDFSVYSVGFSPDDRTLAGVDTESGDTYLWNTATGKLAGTLKDPTASGGPAWAAFSPDGRTLATPDTQSGDTYLWNTATGKLTATIPGPGAGIPGPAPNARDDTAAFSPDGRTLAIADNDGTTYLINASTRKRIAALKDPQDEYGAPEVVFSPDSRTLAVAVNNSFTYVWNTATRKLTAAVSGPPLYIDIGAFTSDAVAFSPDGRTLATVGLDGTINLWRMPGS